MKCIDMGHADIALVGSYYMQYMDTALNSAMNQLIRKRQLVAQQVYPGRDKF